MGCLEPGGSKTKIGLFILLFKVLIVPRLDGFLGARGTGWGLFVNYKNSESPLDGASWAEIMGDYLVTGEVLPFLEVGSGAPPKFPENIF
jgi:hypothetical protein